MKKHIIIVASHYPPHVGGIESYTLLLAHEFLKKKYIVSIITTNTSFSEFKTAEDGIVVYRLSSFQLLNKRFPLPYSLSQLIEIGMQVFKPGATCIIQTRFFPLSLIAGIICQLRSIRCIVVEHGSGHFTYPSFIKTKIASLYEHAITAFLTMIAQPTYVAVSQAAADWLLHFKLKAKKIVGNGVAICHPELVSGSHRKGMLKQAMPAGRQVQHDDKTIMYAGRLIKEKGIHELIEGFTLFSKTHTGYRLIIAGDGELATELIDKSAHNPAIVYTGALSHQETLNWMQHASVYIHPSYYPEGLPTSLLEAGAFSVPVISSLSGGSAELITHMKTGYVLSEISPENIYKALMYMTTHQKEATDMGHMLYMLVKEQYNWSVVMGRFEKIIDDLD